MVLSPDVFSFAKFSIDMINQIKIIKKWLGNKRIPMRSTSKLRIAAMLNFLNGTPWVPAGNINK